MSTTSLNSQYSSTSGIMRLDDIRNAKRGSIDQRQINYVVKKEEEKNLKKELIELEIECGQVKRDITRLETKVIPNLERQLEKARYNGFSKSNQTLMHQLDDVIEIKTGELETLGYINSQIESIDIADIDGSMRELMQLKA